MKRIVDSALVAFGLLVAGIMTVRVVNVIGYRPWNSEQRQAIESQVSAMRERLALSDQQATQVRYILEDSARRLNAVRGTSSRSAEVPTRSAIEAVRRIRFQTGERMRRVLDATQWRGYSEMLDERRRDNSSGPSASTRPRAA